jgi:hypothetical protein
MSLYDDDKEVQAAAPPCCRWRHHHPVSIAPPLENVADVYWQAGRRRIHSKYNTKKQFGNLNNGTLPRNP